MLPELKKNTFIPLYRQLAEMYRNAIITRELCPGDRVHSISELQKRHNVSRETAKIVLTTLVREGFIVSKAGKGSFVANLRPRKKIWAVVLPFYSAQYEDLLYELSKQALAAGRGLHHFIDYNRWKEEIRLVGHLINERYEAVVVVPTVDESKTSDFYRTLSPRETIVVLADHTITGSFFGYAIQSYDLGVQRGVRYLFEKSRGALAFVRNEIWAGRNLIQELMEQSFTGFVKELRPASEHRVIEHLATIDAAFLKKHGIDGLFCCDDSDAIRIIGRLREQGIVIPDECALVSYGNTELARFFTPAISSIDPHNSEIAHKCAEIVNMRIHNENTRYSQFVIQPELVIRQT